MPILASGSPNTMQIPSFSPSSSAILSLFLAVGLWLLGAALGQRLLRALRIQPANAGECVVLGGALGLGALSYTFLALGLAGLLRPWAVWTTLGVVAIWAIPCLRARSRSWREDWATVGPQALFEQIGATLVLVMLLIVLLRGLAPVTDYDGLAYHLVTPRDFLEAGRIYTVPGEAHPNFPLAVDLLFIPAIALGLDNAARLVHLGFGALMGLGVFTLARRLLRCRRGSWLALFVFSTTPIIGTVGGYAHNDLGWALFEFLAAYALIVWTQEGEKRWLVLAGILAGFGLGSKYLGLPMLGVLGAAVLYHDRFQARKAWRSIVADGLWLGLVAVGVAAPWYLKNWLWLGNPVYPLWFGGKGWDAFLSAKLEFMGKSYGPRRGILGILLLPLDIFRYSIGYFGPIPFAFPTPLSLLLPLYLFVRSDPAISLILLMALLRFATWVISARNTRYLIDIYPLLSVAVAYLLAELSRRRMAHVLVQVAVLALMVANLTWQTLLLLKEDPLPVVLGLESREEYLSEHNYPAYRVIRFINQLPHDNRVLFVGDGQGYYATVDHVADVNHSNWGHLVYQVGEDPVSLRHALAVNGFTHVYYSGRDFEWQLNFDYDGHLAHEVAVFEQFAVRCTDVVYDEQTGGRVYAILEKCAEGG